MIYRIDERRYNKLCGIVENVACPKCGNSTSYAKIRNKTKVSLYFIPIICCTNATFVQCTVCKAAYIVNRKRFNKINESLEVLDAIYEQYQSDLEKQQKIRAKYSVGVSEIKQSEALLSCLGVQFGLPFFFLGRPILGVLSFVSSFALIIYDKLQFVGILPMIGLVLALFIAAGKVKDGKGKYILSAKQREAFLGEKNII